MRLLGRVFKGRVAKNRRLTEPMDFVATFSVVDGTTKWK